MHDETNKVVYLMDNHNLYITITEMIQIYTSPKEELIRAWLSDYGLYITISIIHNGYYPKDYTTFCSLRPGLYILMQKPIMIHTCHLVKTFLKLY